MFKKLWQVIWYLLISVKSEYVSGWAEADFELLPQTIFLWRSVLVKRYLEKRLNYEWREEVVVWKEILPELLKSVRLEWLHKDPELEGNASW